MAIYLFFGLSYFLGSIPFGLIFSVLSGKGDIRKIGSGNIGATNVLRTGSRFLALCTFLADALKGAFVVVWMGYCDAPFIDQCIAGFLAIIGHIFPVWLGLRGGKGVATSLGVYVAIHPIVGILTMLSWLLAARFFHISSLAALFSFFLAPIYAFVYEAPRSELLLMVVVYVLLLWTHRSNIRRLITGKENNM